MERPPEPLSLGFPVPGWTPPPPPSALPMEGRYCRLEAVDPTTHGPELYEAFSEDRQGLVWTYLPYGPFESLEQYRSWLTDFCTGNDPMFYSVLDEEGMAAGVASFLRIDPPNGSIEVGHIAYAPRLQRTRAGTEAMYLMMRRVFDELGYRRYEWKCDSLNRASRDAAARLGFSYEGTFRQAGVVKGRNRDTAWYSILDREWAALRPAYERWLDPANFDRQGQRSRLSERIRAVQAKPESPGAGQH